MRSRGHAPSAHVIWPFPLSSTRPRASEFGWESGLPEQLESEWQLPLLSLRGRQHDHFG